jgi:hypothetical protein
MNFKQTIGKFEPTLFKYFQTVCLQTSLLPAYGEKLFIYLRMHRV